MLPSLRIQNFRRFRDLSIPRLGSVNLFVGRNSSGKSSVLEAIRLAISDGSPGILRDILRLREEIPSSSVSSEAVELTGMFRRGASPRMGLRIDAGRRFFEARTRLFSRARRDDGGVELRPVDSMTAQDEAYLYLEMTTPARVSRIRADRVPRRFDVQGDAPETPCVFIGTDGLGRQSVTELWSAVVLTELECSGSAGNGEGVLPVR